MIETCHGCRIYNQGVRGDHNMCAFIEFNDECPCPKCIIKMVCIVACPEFKLFRNKYVKNFDTNM